MRIPVSALEADVIALEKALFETVVGDICTYKALSDAIGRDVKDARYLVLKAIKRLNSEHGCLFSVVFRVGYKRLESNEFHAVGKLTRAKIRRVANRKSAEIAHAVERANDLSPEDMRKAIAEVSTLNLIAHLSTEKAVAKQQTDNVKPVAVSLKTLLKNLEEA